jgi:hypothetical protein
MQVTCLYVKQNRYNHGNYERDILISRRTEQTQKI